jgi:hypothetical protein
MPLGFVLAYGHLVRDYRKVKNGATRAPLEKLLRVPRSCDPPVTPRAKIAIGWVARNEF